MPVRIRPYREIRAASSVMEIWPTSTYVEHMPKGTPQQRMAQYWRSAGTQLHKSIKAYEQSSHD